MKKIKASQFTNLCIELDKLDGLDPKNCQEQKRKALQMAREIGFVVGVNGNRIEIHENVGYFNEFNKDTLVAELFINNALKITVNSDHLWNIAEGMEIQERGDY